MSKVSVKLDFIVREMEKQNLPYWTIKDGSKVVASQNEAMSVVDSVSQLRQYVSALSGSSVTVSISSKSNTEKAQGGRNYVHREYDLLLSSVGIVGHIGAGNASLYETISDLKVKLVEQDFNYRLKALEEKKENDSPLGSLEPLLGPLIQKMLGMTPALPGAIAGPPSSLTELLNQWEQVDPEYIKVISSVVAIAVNDPTTYKNFKPMLFNAVR